MMKSGSVLINYCAVRDSSFTKLFMHLNAFFANGRFTMHSKKYIERVGRIRIFKHIAVEDLTKTFATVYYYSQADLIWPDIGTISLGNTFVWKSLY
jgi:hypothetical protein